MLRAAPEPGWVQLSRGPAPRRDSRPPAPSSSSSPGLSPSPPQGLLLRFAAFPEQLVAAGGRACGRACLARLSGQCWGHGAAAKGRSSSAAGATGRASNFSVAGVRGGGGGTAGSPCRPPAAAHLPNSCLRARPPSPDACTFLLAGQSGLCTGSDCAELGRPFSSPYRARESGSRPRGLQHTPWRHLSPSLGPPLSPPGPL